MTCMIAQCQHITYMHHMDDLKDRPFQMRVSDAWLRRLDEWRRQQADLPSRAEAIRRLVEIGIRVSKGD